MHKCRHTGGVAGVAGLVGLLTSWVLLTAGLSPSAAGVASGSRGPMPCFRPYCTSQLNRCSRSSNALSALCSALSYGSNLDGLRSSWRAVVEMTVQHLAQEMSHELPSSSGHVQAMPAASYRGNAWTSEEGMCWPWGPCARLTRQ